MGSANNWCWLPAEGQGMGNLQEILLVITSAHPMSTPQVMPSALGYITSSKSPQRASSCPGAVHYRQQLAQRAVCCRCRHFVWGQVRCPCIERNEELGEFFFLMCVKRASVLLCACVRAGVCSLTRGEQRGALCFGWVEGAASWAAFSFLQLPLGIKGINIPGT